MSGNGVDLGAVYQAVIALSRDLQGFRNETKRDVSDLKRDVFDLKRDVTDVRQEMTELRATLTHYHSSVVGHGILISELEARVRHIEAKLEGTART